MDYTKVAVVALLLTLSVYTTTAQTTVQGSLPILQSSGGFLRAFPTGATATFCAANTSGLPCSPALYTYSPDINGNIYYNVVPGVYTVTVTGVNIAQPVSYQLNLGSNAFTLSLTNWTAQGTTQYTLTCFQANGFATNCPLNAGVNSQIVGVCTANCGNSGNAIVLVGGLSLVYFDGAPTINDFVVGSPTQVSYAHDAGSTLPTGTEVLGTVAQQGGTTCVQTSPYLCYVYFLTPNSTAAGGGGGVATSFGTSSNPVANTAATQRGQRYINQGTSPNNFAIASGLGYELADWSPVADDSTDNCTAITNWASAVNAYSGNGIPIASCSMGPGDKAYKTSCGALFTQAVKVYGPCTFDYTGTGDMFGLGPSGLASFPTIDPIPSGVFNVTIIGGNGPARSGIHVYPFICASEFSNVMLYNYGTGATWPILGDGDNCEATFQNLWVWSGDTTTGRNGMKWGTSATNFSNTFNMVNSHIESNACGGIGLDYAGSHSTITATAFYGFGNNIRLELGTFGVKINELSGLDNVACAGPGGQKTNIALGSAGSGSGSINEIEISGIDVSPEFGTTFFDKAADMSGALTLNNFNVHDNMGSLGSPFAATSLSGSIYAFANRNLTFPTGTIFLFTGDGTNNLVAASGGGGSALDIGVSNPATMTRMRIGDFQAGNSSTGNVNLSFFNDNDGSFPGDVVLTSGVTANSFLALDTDNGSVSRLTITRGGTTAFTGDTGVTFTKGITMEGSQSISGCSLTSAVGGAAAGKFASGTTGACTVTITLPASPGGNGWSCWANDLTTPADVLHQTGSIATTSATISGTTTSGDVVTWGCVGF